jgi:hypothetical protein
MTEKKYDLAVKIREYTDSTGKKKAVWQNVGSIMQTDDGGEFIMLARWFNPAGLPNPDNRDTVIISKFEPKPRELSPAQQQHSEAKANGYAAQKDGGIMDMESDIPF